MSSPFAPLSIPADVVDEVLQAIPELGTLKRCMLTSKLFYYLTRQHLFRTFEIDAANPDPTHISSLSQFLTFQHPTLGAPPLITCIRNLSVILESIDVRLKEPNVQGLDHLLKLFCKLSAEGQCLTGFTLQGSRDYWIPVKWIEIPTSIRESLVSLGNASTITELKVSRIRGVPLRFMFGAPNCRSLVLRELTAVTQSTPWSPLDTEPALPKLSSLSLHLPQLFVAHDFIEPSVTPEFVPLDQFLLRITPSSLRKLSLQTPVEGAGAAEQRRLLLLANELRELELFYGVNFWSLSSIVSLTHRPRQDDARHSSELPLDAVPSSLEYLSLLEGSPHAGIFVSDVESGTFEPRNLIVDVGGNPESIFFPTELGSGNATATTPSLSLLTISRTVKIRQEDSGRVHGMLIDGTYEPFWDAFAKNLLQLPAKRILLKLLVEWDYHADEEHLWRNDMPLDGEWEDSSEFCREIEAFVARLRNVEEKTIMVEFRYREIMSRREYSYAHNPRDSDDEDDEDDEESDDEDNEESGSIEYYKNDDEGDAEEDAENENSDEHTE